MSSLVNKLRGVFKPRTDKSGLAEVSGPPAWKNEADLRAKLALPFSGLSVGGFVPTGNPDATTFGEIRLGRWGEEWPSYHGEPLWPLCQLNLQDAPWRPDTLEDIALLNIWVSRKYLDIQKRVVSSLERPDYTGWFVRSYETLDGLEQITCPKTDSAILPFECKWNPSLGDDYPGSDMAPDLSDDVRLTDFKWCQTQVQTKLGGWPATVHGQPWWETDPDGAEFEYALQIDSESKTRWSWGNGGTGFIARSRDAPHRWALDFQSY